MSLPSRRASRWAGIGALTAGLVASGALVWQASYSAVSATTSNPTNNWSAGTVALSDDDTNTALFTAANLKPGSTGTKCIVVTSTGSLPSLVKLYGTNPATTNALSSSINLSVVQGNGGSNSSCTGFAPLSSGSSLYAGTLSAFGSSAAAYSTGVGNWTTTGTASESRTYQFSYTLDPATPNSAQNGTAAIAFTWEAQNT